MPTDLKIVTVKLPKADLRRIPRQQNRSDFIREAVSEKLDRLDSPEWKPKTPLGKTLVSLSNRFKGERLDADDIAAELRERRGGLS
jgi:Arc/MetJ-type ribon-helix-helix transcriptional regulator